MDLDHPTFPIVQISLDLRRSTSARDRRHRRRRRRGRSKPGLLLLAEACAPWSAPCTPNHPIVADLKRWTAVSETEMMAKAGANLVVIWRAHEPHPPGGGRAQLRRGDGRQPPRPIASPARAGWKASASTSSSITSGTMSVAWWQD
jgi:hypothetical protein